MHQKKSPVAKHHIEDAAHDFWIGTDCVMHPLMSVSKRCANTDSPSKVQARRQIQEMTNAGIPD
jgi:hypothetical protein